MDTPGSEVVFTPEPIFVGLPRPESPPVVPGPTETPEVLGPQVFGSAPVLADRRVIEGVIEEVAIGPTEMPEVLSPQVVVSAPAATVIQQPWLNDSRVIKEVDPSVATETKTVDELTQKYDNPTMRAFTDQPGGYPYLGIIGIKGVWVTTETGTLFANSFTSFLLLLFFIPLYLVISVILETNMYFWVSHDFSPYWFIILLVLYIGTHAYHVYTQKTSKWLVLLCLLLSSGSLFAVSETFIKKTEFVYTFLVSSDCDTYSGKRLMQLSWDAADTLYIECLANESSVSGKSVAELMDVMKVQDCPTYSTELVDYPTWSYLETLETSLQCSGWCDASTPLWTTESTKDSCSVSVGFDLREYGYYTLNQVRVYSIVVLLFSALMMLQGGKILASYGIDWQ